MCLATMPYIDLCTAAQYMLLLLVLAINSDQFQILRSYMLLL